MSKVVSLNEHKEKKEEEVVNEPVVEKTPDEIFAEIEKKNAETKRRKEKERLKANRDVLRSYRIK